IRLMYASNIPVILVAEVLANVSMFSLLFWQHPEWPILGHASWIGAYPDATDPRVVSGQIQRTTPIGGLAYYFSNVNGVQDWLLPLFNPTSYGVYLRGLEYWQVFVHILVFLLVFIGGSVMFAKFWIMTTNMGPEDVARQIESSGMQIPGFRRGPPVLRRVLDRSNRKRTAEHRQTPAVRVRVDPAQVHSEPDDVDGLLLRGRVVRDQEIPRRSGERYVDRAATRTPEGPQAPEVRPGAVVIVLLLRHDEEIQRTAGDFLVISPKTAGSEDVDLVIHVVPEAGGDGRRRRRGRTEGREDKRDPGEGEDAADDQQYSEDSHKSHVALDQARPSSVRRPVARGLPHGRTPRRGNWSEEP